MTYIIATDKKWNECLAERLGYDFILITHKNELTKGNIESISPEFIFFPHWSHIIPSEIYEIYECVVFHMTDLPFGRGGSPLQNLILRGHKETKISAIKCVKELDAGAVYLKENLSLKGSAEDIYLRARDIIGDMIIKIINENPEPKPQEGKTTKFKRRTPEQSDISNVSGIRELYDYIRMLDAPTYPKAYIETDKFVFEFTDAGIKDNIVSANVTIRRKDGK